jgi:serine/threonine-protein kinase
VHEAATGNEQLLAAMMRPAPPMASIVPQVPAGFAEVVDRALAYEKADRYANAADMRTAVRAAYAQLKGNGRPSDVRLSVPAFAEPAEESQETAAWDATEVEPALAPMPRRVASALRARWRTALLVASALVAATIALAGLRGRSDEPTETATSTRHDQTVPLPPEPEPVAVPTLSATTPSPTPILAVTQTAKRPRDAPKPRARPANPDDDDPGPSRK